MSVIAEKNNILQKFTPLSYVQSGLIGLWDGEWNAGKELHDPYAMVWKNLKIDSEYAGYKILDISIPEVPIPTTDEYSWESKALKRVGVGGIEHTIPKNVTWFEFYSVCAEKKQSSSAVAMNRH